MYTFMSICFFLFNLPLSTFVLLFKAPLLLSSSSILHHLRSISCPRLPDSIFLTKIPNWVNTDCLVKEEVGIFYGNLVYFMAVWYILCLFGIIYGHLVYFITIWFVLMVPWYIFPALVCCTRKNLATLLLSSLHVSITPRYCCHSADFKSRSRNWDKPLLFDPWNLFAVYWSCTFRLALSV
jgi:hypothetical protein